MKNLQLTVILNERLSADVSNHSTAYMYIKSTDANIEMTEMLEWSDKDFKVAIIKYFSKQL